MLVNLSYMLGLRIITYNIARVLLFLSHAVFSMARLSLQSKHRFVTLYSRSYAVSEIQWRLRKVGTTVSYQAVFNLLWKFCEKTTIKDLPILSNIVAICESAIRNVIHM